MWFSLKGENQQRIIIISFGGRHLFGKKKGRSLEIMNSFELVFNVIEERDIVIDRDYYNTKEEQCMKQENN